MLRVTSDVYIDPQDLDRFLDGPSGDIARDLLRRGVRVENAAKLNATGREYGDGTRGPRVQTGRLRTSITHALGHDSRGLFVDVGTNVVYGRYLELGQTRSGRKFPFLQPALAAAQD